MAAVSDWGRAGRAHGMCSCSAHPSIHLPRLVTTHIQPTRPAQPGIQLMLPMHASPPCAGMDVYSLHSSGKGAPCYACGCGQLGTLRAELHLPAWSTSKH